MLGVGGLLVGVIWLVITNNIDEYYGSMTDVAEVADAPAETGKSASTARKPQTAIAPKRPDQGNIAGLKSPEGANISPGEKKPQDFPKADRMDGHHFAVQLYEESAENGDSDAQYKLGLLYLTGNGALQDFAEAAKWLKLAAEQGYALAQYELGLIYRGGYGLAIDQVQSYVWLNLAAAAGVQQAVGARDDVMRSLNTRQLAQAQKISRDWLASRTKSKSSGTGTGKSARPAGSTGPTGQKALRQNQPGQADTSPLVVDAAPQE
jgi:TPR repeat protein